MGKMSFEDYKYFYVNWKKMLEKDIEELEEEICFKKAYCMFYPFKQSAYRRLPFEYISSSYQVRNEEISEMITATFEPEYIDFALARLANIKDNYTIEYMVLQCVSCENTADGVIFTLKDPFRTIITTPYKLKEPAFKDFLDFRNRMLRIKLKFSETMTSQEPVFKGVEILKLEKLNFFVHGDVDPLLEYDRPYSPLIQQKFDELKGVEGYEHCKKAVEDYATKIVELSIYNIVAFDKSVPPSFVYIREFSIGLEYVLIYKRGYIEYIINKCGGVNFIMDVDRESILKELEMDDMTDEEKEKFEYENGLNECLLPKYLYDKIWK